MFLTPIIQIFLFCYVSENKKKKKESLRTKKNLFLLGVFGIEFKVQSFQLWIKGLSKIELFQTDTYSLKRERERERERVKNQQFF
jgi:hypothetical protein